MLWKRIPRAGVFRILGIAVFLAACAAERGNGDSNSLIVAVPVHPIAGLVDALAPDGLLQVVVLVPPAANPATHEPSMQALRSTAKAVLYLEVGHPDFMFERTWLNGALEGSTAVRLPLFEQCPVLDEDPHMWLSTQCLGKAAPIVATALIGIFPEQAESIAANLESYMGRIEEVANSTERRLSPHRDKVFFVLHPAWGYLAHDNGLRQVEILSHGTGDPGASRIAEIIRLGRRERVQTIFAQPQFNLAPANLIAEELEATVLSLDPLARDPLYAIEEVTSSLVAEFERRLPE